MPEPTSITFPFAHRGLVAKLQPGELQPGQYLRLQNLQALQEGALSTRSGRKLLGVMDAAHCSDGVHHDLPHTIVKLRVSDTDTSNIRYIGEGVDIFRTTDYANFTRVAQGVVDAADAVLKRWTMAAYNAGTSGKPWAFFACPNSMLKDYGTTPLASLQRWGILPAWGACTASAGAATTKTVTDASNASPIRVTFSVAHGLSDGAHYKLENVTDNTAANGTWYLKVSTCADPLTEADLYWDAAMSDPSSGNGTFAAGTATATAIAGPDSSAPGSSLYDYVFTYRNVTNGNEGNPSQEMIAGVAADNQPISVQVWGTEDAQISKAAGAQSIAIYRRGGTFTDGKFRLVGYATNPGEAAGTPTDLGGSPFVDSSSDYDIRNAKIAEFDNDPPVPSSLPTPIVGTLAGGPYAVGWRDVTVSVATLVTSGVTAGTKLSIRGANAEDVVIFSVLGASQVRVYLQKAHAAGEQFEISTITAQPCRGCFTALDNVFIYGDPNNPHILYQSKSGRPESFPVQSSEGVVRQVNVGSPSNPIVAACEAPGGGEIVCLNRSGIFVVKIWNGQMLAPIQTPAQRGLYSNFGWVLGDNALYYHGYDGFYRWAGGDSQKIAEALDPLFNKKTLGEVAYFDFLDTGADPPRRWVKFEFFKGELLAMVRDSAGKTRVVRIEPAYDFRARIDNWNADFTNGGLSPTQITNVFVEKDVGRLIVCKWATDGGVISDYDLDGTAGTTDEWSGDGTDGEPIQYDLKTGFFWGDDPTQKKVFNDILLELDNPGGDVWVDLHTDYNASAASLGQWQIAADATSGRHWVSLMPALNQWDAPAVAESSAGLEAQAVALRIYNVDPNGSAGATKRTTFYRLKFVYTPLAPVTAGRATEWRDFGHPHDKRGYLLRIKYDAGTSDRIIHLDTKSGIDGTTYNRNVQEFTLPGFSDLVPPGINIKQQGGRREAQCTFPITDGTIFKTARLRPDATATAITAETKDFFQIYDWEIVCENLPPDIVPFTPWDDGGTPFEKYPQQIEIDVNTNGQDVPVQVQADGTTIQTVTVNTTINDRRRQIALSAVPKVSGRKWRLLVDTAAIPPGGMFQLFSHNFDFLPADRGPISHTIPWTDLGHPWDKRLETITIEWENPALADVTIVMDTITGIEGNTENVNVQTFALPTSARGKKTFPMLDQLVVKMIRLYPQAVVPAGFRMWIDTVKKVDYPPDKVAFTDYTDFGYPWDKNPPTVTFNLDTGGVNCTVNVECDGAVVATYTVNTNYNTRLISRSMPADIRGKLWRLTLAWGAGGKAQLFAWDLPNFTRDPADDIDATPWEDFGYVCDKLARELVVNVDTGGVAASVQLQADGVTVQTISINTTYTNRKQVIALNANLIGKLWRLVPTRGVGGKFKLWKWKINYAKEPCAVLAIDTYETDFGYAGWKWIKRGWLHYRCASQVTLTILRDNAETFYSTTLPAHTNRDVYEFYLPENVGAALNKSKTYRIQLSAASPIKPYSDSRLEWMPCALDQRQAFQSYFIRPEEPFAVMESN